MTVWRLGREWALWLLGTYIVFLRDDDSTYSYLLTAQQCQFSGNTNPKTAAYVNKQKMLKKKAIPRFKAPYKHVQYQMGGVSYVNDRPQYLLNSKQFLFPLIFLKSLIWFLHFSDHTQVAP